jgi:hypothetical protein
LQEEFSRRLDVSERQALAAQDERDAIRAQLRDVEGECDRLASQLVKMERRAEAAEREAESIQDEWQAAKEEADLELEQVREEANKRLEAANNEAGKVFQQSQQQQQKEAKEALAAALEREASLTKTINETRMAMEEAASVASDREYQLRDEAASLEKRLRELETVNRQLQSTSGDAAAGASLLRQLESMTAAAARQHQAAEETENRLAAQVAELRRHVAENEAMIKEAARTIDVQKIELVAAKQAHKASKLSLLKAQEDLKLNEQRCIELESELAQTQSKLTHVGVSFERHISAAAAEQQQLQESLYEAKEVLLAEAARRKELEQQLSSQKANLAVATLAETVTEAVEVTLPGVASESHVIEEDEMDAIVRNMSIGSTNSNSLTNATSANKRLMPMLQQQLRLAEAARDASNEQLVIALEEVDKSRIAAQHATNLQKQLVLVTNKLDVALEVLGEKNERVEALEEDIRDMKAIFHEQLALVADQLAAARAQQQQQQQKN